jgi:replication factor C small subunit
MAKIKRIEHTLFIEKYRINDIEQYLGSDEIKNNVRQYIKDNDLPHLLFSGPAGSGKTTLAKLIVHNLNCDYQFINASDENGIDIIRDKIKAFASAASFKPLKIVILDEADFLTQPAQAALRFVIEEFSLNTRFILTCNYETKIIPALKSRCELFKIIPPSKGEIAKHLASILDIEKITYELVDLAQIINKYYPDVRSMLKKLQSLSKTGTLIIPSTIEEDDYQSQILVILKKPTSKSWYQIRQLVINQQLDDYQPLFRFLFDNMSEYAIGKEPNVAILLDDAIWHASLVSDKEINAAALFAKLLDSLK